MKKNVLIGGIIMVALAFAFFSQPAADEQATDDRKVVLTTFTVLADMAQNIAGDAVRVESLTKPGANIHSYEPTPSDLVRAQGADLVLDNGLNLELWAEKLYEGIPDVPHVTLTDGITPLSITEGSYEGKANPHAWMSPKNALVYTQNIEAALIDLAPEHTALFQKNAQEYRQKILDLDTQIRSQLAELPENKRFLVTCEGAFTYLTTDYNLTEIYMWPINADANGTPQQVAKVIDAVKEYDIPTVYCESTVSTKPMEQVADESGATFGGTFYVDSLTEADGDAPTFLDLLTYNTKTLIEGWQ